MTPEEASRRLRALAQRVSRLKPLNHDPEKFFVDRGEVENDLLGVAEALAPGRIEARRHPDSKFRTGAIQHRGRSIAVETRAPRTRRPSEAEMLARKAFK